MNIAEFYLSKDTPEMVKPLLRVICDRPLKDGALHRVDVAMLNLIKILLSETYEELVTWYWFK